MKIMLYIIEILDVHETHAYFSLEMLWSTLAPAQDSSIDPMLKGDNKELSKIINI